MKFKGEMGIDREVQATAETGHGPSRSLWHKTDELAPHMSLNGDMCVDVAVIGAGLTGILTAHYLTEAGLKTIVLEAARLGSGQTGNTTAKITSQHGLIYHRLIEQFGKEKAQQYAAANQWAIEEYAKLIESRGIDCDFCRYPAYLYSKVERQALEKEFSAADTLGISATLCRDSALPFPIKAALRFENQACFHPLKFLSAMADTVELYEDTRVKRVDGHCLITDRGRIQADHVVFACHYPFVNIPGYYFMRIHQERSYVLALENAQELHGMYLGIDGDGLSFRNQGKLLLLGGGGHRCGENSAGGQYEKLREAAKSFWPAYKEQAHWSAQDCMTLDGIPYIGRFSESTPDWYVATGFQKWGMSSAMVSAKIIRDLILNGDSPWAQVFSPQRFKPTVSAKALMEETAQAAKGLGRRIIIPPSKELKALPKGHGGIVEYQGEKLGAYKNEKGELFIVYARCPHLGCQLEWNPDEKSWDCPCHGSRFDYEGRLLDNPAQSGLERP